MCRVVAWIGLKTPELSDIVVINTVLHPSCIANAPGLKGGLDLYPLQRRTEAGARRQAL